MAEAGKAGAVKARGAKRAPGAAGGAADPKVLGQVARMLMRAIWAQQWLATHPKAKPEERKAAWAEVRDTLVAKNLKSYRKALAALSKAGVEITLRDGAGKAATAEDDAD